jgi:hypothetical protein
MADYALLSELVTGYLPSVTGTDEQATLAAMLTRASRTIDSRTRRPVNAFAPAPDETSAQVVYGADSPVLVLPEFITGSVMSVTAPADYMPEDYREFRRREATTGSGIVGLHTSNKDGVLTPRVVWTKGAPFTVTARWGFVETPAEITEACLKLVTHWWRQQPGDLSGPQGDLQQDRRMDRSGIPRSVDDLLAPYVLKAELRDEDEGTIERGELLDADHNPWRNPYGGSGGGGGKF